MSRSLFFLKINPIIFRKICYLIHTCLPNVIVHLVDIHKFK